jgi:hypothetical protein
MGSSNYTFTLIVPAPGANVAAERQICNIINSFSVICLPGSTWSYQILDGDGFQISSSQVPMTGPQNVTINSRTSDFVFILQNASADTYQVRVYGG